MLRQLFTAVTAAGMLGTSPAPQTVGQPSNDYLTQAPPLAAKLQQYLDQVTADQTISVSFTNLAPIKDGPRTIAPKGLTIDANGDARVVAASTYKLFVAAHWFAGCQESGYRWSDPVSDGFDRMVLNSENDFSEAYLKAQGKDNVNQFLQQRAIAPVFSPELPAQTTTNDLRHLLVDLAEANGPFEDNVNRIHLLALMQQQVYRRGIPAGVQAVTPNAIVQDKVGFLGDQNNDAAIITTPTQKYVLVIATRGHHQQPLDFDRTQAVAQQVARIVSGG